MIKNEDHASDDRRTSSTVDTSAAEAALNARLSRKRTKTGCLTCRKRRIKCGEERPVCRNCIKSKRHCEGYNQRVVFKPPTFEYQPAPNGGAHITFQAGPVQSPSQQHHDLQSQQLDPSIYGQLRPRPVEHQYTTFWDGQLQRYITVQQPHLQQGPPAEQVRPPFHFGQTMPVVSPVYTFQGQPSSQSVPTTPQVVDSGQHISPIATSSVGYFSNQTPQYAPSQVHADTNYTIVSGTTATTLPAEYVAQVYQQPLQAAQYFPNEAIQQSPDTTSAFPPYQPWHESKPSVSSEHDSAHTAPLSATSSRTMSLAHQPTFPSQPQWTAQVPPGYTPSGTVEQSASSWPPSTHSLSAMPFSQAPVSLSPEYYEHEGQTPTFHSTTDVLNAAAVETQDDDYFDVDSDEEVDVSLTQSPQEGHKRQRTLGRILANNKISTGDLQTRRYDTFLYAGILDHYRVDEVASPLRNPATARVFAHFVSATGPSLSIFERHPRNTSVLFAEGGVPLSQQGLWTYTMPMAALRNQGLLHAMLAIASLHIARLQNASVTPSMQHYAWALRRIHASVGKPQSRLKVATMAASMLLGFYEIMTADHMKWNTHLAGSKQLFIETDFEKMSKEFRRLKLERAETLGYRTGSKRRHSGDFSQGSMLDQIPDVDDRLISEMTGREVRYGDHGHVEAPHMHVPPGLDLGKFEILKDLYWWYCKQDVYQSLISGNPLLMDYSRWGNCPPRAPLGRADAVFGTFDHLVLLLGRIADFASRDRERKLLQIEANGGQWRPSPGMNIPRPPQQAPPPQGAPPGYGSAPPQGPPQGPPPGGPNAMPQFYGMAPPPRANVHAPATYAPLTPMYSELSPETGRPPRPREIDLRERTDAALQEYGRIRAALHTFSASLGDAFQPLTAESHYPMNTPFGTAHFYRQYDIGCLWALYNMAMIIIIRSHPHMPPAAHAAAGIAAQDTSHYANEIGRIAAGIVPGPLDQPLNPTLGAALCESCTPSFFAAVQYRDLEQRHTTVKRIYSIAKRTGWGSAELIANGCETAWVKAAAAGRGPPYTRIIRPDAPSEDPRLNGSWENLDPNANPDEMDDSDRRLIKSKANARLNWAIGVMGVEADEEKLSQM